MSIQKQYPFTTPGNYTYDSGLIEITGGKAKLKIFDNPNQDFIEDFASDVGFTYDSDKAEFSGGKLQQKLQALPANAMCCGFFDSKDILLGLGSVTGTLRNGATVSGGLADCSSVTQKRSVDYDADLNADSQQTGCIMIKAKVDYSGTPSNTQFIFMVCDADGSSKNQIALYHSSANGQLYLHVRDQGYVNIFQTSMGQWNPTSGTTYFFQLNYDFTAGATSLYIGGVQKGSTLASTGTRNSNIGLFRIGNNEDNSFFTELFFDGFAVYSIAQAVVSDFPANVPQNLYLASKAELPQFSYSGAGAIQAFSNFVMTETGSPKYVMIYGIVVAGRPVMDLILNQIRLPRYWPI